MYSVDVLSYLCFPVLYPLSYFQKGFEVAGEVLEVGLLLEIVGDGSAFLFSSSKWRSGEKCNEAFIFDD